MVSRLSVFVLVSCGLFSVPVWAQSPPDPIVGFSRSDADLDALHGVPAPRQQTDLDTVRLAAAQRENTASMQERTDGLWQSWRVSICKGCGVDESPPGERVKAYFKARDVASGDRAPVHQAENPRPRGQGRTASLYDDLSTENLDRIRRGPAQ